MKHVNLLVSSILAGLFISTLIADTEKTLVEAMGVWGEKSMYGRKYMGTFRTTFIINEEGVIEHVFLPKQIKTKTHADQIRDYLKG